MGHAEVSAGLCSIAKCIVMIHKSIIPSNLLFEPIDTDIPGIKEGTLKVYLLQNILQNIYRHV